MGRSSWIIRVKSNCKYQFYLGLGPKLFEFHIRHGGSTEADPWLITICQSLLSSNSSTWCSLMVNEWFTSCWLMINQWLLHVVDNSSWTIRTLSSSCFADQRWRCQPRPTCTPSTVRFGTLASSWFAGEAPQGCVVVTVVRWPTLGEL